MPNLIYLHGFLSSPGSSKALATEQWLQQNRPAWQFFCPALSSYPDVAINQITALLNDLKDQPTALIGSSLGGFWATGFAAQYRLPAVLINPAVSPQIRFHEFVGNPLQNYYSQETYTLTNEHLAHLLNFDLHPIPQPQSLWVMVQTGDETLDYRLAVQKYASCKLTIEEGGNHSFIGYTSWLPQIMAFFDEQLSSQHSAIQPQ